MKVLIKVVIRDREGKVIKTLRKEAHSYVRGMIDLLRILMGVAITSCVDTAGNTFSSSTGWGATFTATASAGFTANGIRVGTSTTAVLITNYNLWSMISHGVGAGQLDYGASSVGAPATVGTARRFICARQFTNSSGASITVHEVGLVVYAQDEFSVTRYILIDRTLLDFTIPNGAAATVTYTIKVTV